MNEILNKINPWYSLKGLPKDLWILFFTTLINRSGTMVIVFLAIYLNKGLGIEIEKAGFVLLVYGLAALLTSPFVGKLSDKIGALKIMEYSLILTGILLFFFPFVKDYNSILVFTFIWSVISEAFRPASLAIISEITKPEQRKVGFAVNRLAINIGMSIGPVLGGIFAMIDYSILFYADGITSLVAGLFLTFFAKKLIVYKKAELEKKEKVKQGKIKPYKDYRFLYFLVTLIPVQIVFFQHLGALPIYIVDDVGMTPAMFGFLSAINTVMIIFLEVPLNNAMSNYPNEKALILGAFLTAFGFGILLFSKSIIIIVLSIVIWTFAEMIYFPASASHASDISPDHQKGEYMGYFQITFNIAFSFGPWFGTFLLSRYGGDILWIVMFCFGLMSAALALFLRKVDN